MTRFALRSRADKHAYDVGIRLADSGAVRISSVSTDVVTTTVHDGATYLVELRMDGEDLFATCSGACADEVCGHAVAAAHALWLAVTGTSS